MPIKGPACSPLKFFLGFPFPSSSPKFSTSPPPHPLRLQGLCSKPSQKKAQTTAPVPSNFLPGSCGSFRVDGLGLGIVCLVLCALSLLLLLPSQVQDLATPVPVALTLDRPACTRLGSLPYYCSFGQVSAHATEHASASDRRLLLRVLLLPLLPFALHAGSNIHDSIEHGCFGRDLVPVVSLSVLRSCPHAFAPDRTCLAWLLSATAHACNCCDSNRSQYERNTSFRYLVNVAS